MSWILLICTHGIDCIPIVPSAKPEAAQCISTAQTINAQIPDIEIICFDSSKPQIFTPLIKLEDSHEEKEKEIL